LISRVQQKKRDNQGAEHVHHRRGNHRGPYPAHVFAQEPPGGVTELGDLEAFHAEGFDHAVSGYRFLKNLTKITQPGLTILGRAPDLTAKFVYRKNHEGEKHGRAQRHSPVQTEDHGDEDQERETFLK
jgi:hypothetical protein